jgi:hypothetical protein
MEIEERNWEEVKKKNMDVLVIPQEKREILTKIGYHVDKKGFLVDEKTGKRVKAEDGEPIKIEKEKEVALIAGTHTFVRDIAGYSQHLIEKKLCKIEAKK